MRRLVSILLIFLISTFSLSSSITDKQNFLITAFLREHSGQYPGGEGAPEYYYHILARNLYNAVNIEDGVAVQMGQGTSLYGDTPVPLFRIEYVTNYLDGVDITVNVSPFQLWDSQANSAVTEVTGDYPTQLKTMLKAKAGFTADHETLTYLQSHGTFVDPGTKYQDEMPDDMVEFSGGSAKIEYNKEEKLNSKASNSFEWVSPQEYEASTGKKDLFSFSYILQKLDDIKSYWNNNGFDIGRWTYSWSFVEQFEEWEGTSKDFIEDGGMITNYVEYSARINDAMPVAPAGQRLEYRMNVTITVENSL